MRIFVLPFTISEILAFQISDIEIIWSTVKVNEHKIRSDAVRWRIPAYIKVISCIFTLARTVPEILRFEMVDLENLGQSDGAQHAQ